MAENKWSQPKNKWIRFGQAFLGYLRQEICWVDVKLIQSILPSSRSLKYSSIIQASISLKASNSRIKHVHVYVRKQFVQILADLLNPIKSLCCFHVKISKLLYYLQEKTFTGIIIQAKTVVILQRTIFLVEIIFVYRESQLPTLVSSGIALQECFYKGYNIFREPV